MPGDGLPAPLPLAIAELGRTPRLLVAVDFDGTLAPIVPDPAAARPLPEAVDPLLRLAELPDTTVAVVSGRARRDLAKLSGLPPAVRLVGSHGAEHDASFADELDEPAAELRERLLGELRRIIEDREGVALEIKPASVAVHVRRAAPEVGAEVLRLVRDGPSGWEGVQSIDGKGILELAVVQADKGAALDVLRRRAGATGVLFIGDDVTDEHAFRRLRGTDVGIKVGPGETAAAYRVADPRAVAAVLTELLTSRFTAR